MESESDPITLTLTNAEAVVFYEFLERFSQDQGLSIQDQAEERVLWDLCCILEKELFSQLISHQYLEVLEQARAKLRDSLL